MPRDNIVNVSVLLYVETQAYEARCEKCSTTIWSLTREYAILNSVKVPFFIAHECPPAKPYWEA